MCAQTLYYAESIGLMFSMQKSKNRKIKYSSGGYAALLSMSLHSFFVLELLSVQIRSYMYLHTFMYK